MVRLIFLLFLTSVLKLTTGDKAKTASDIIKNSGI